MKPLPGFAEVRRLEVAAPERLRECPLARRALDPERVAGQVSDPDRALGHVLEVLRTDWPIRPGKPKEIQSWHDLVSKAGHGAGIYRIELVGPDGRIQHYVGKASDLGRRLASHEKLKGREFGNEPGNIKSIECLKVKPGAWDPKSIDIAERAHIARLKVRYGPDVIINRSVGGEGRPVLAYYSEGYRSPAATPV